MGSGKEKKKQQQHQKKKRFPLQPKKVVNNKRKKEKVKKTRSSSNNGESIENAKSKIKVKDTKLNDIVRFPTAAQQLEFFHEQYQSANRIQLSSLELDSFTETCMLELNPDHAQISSALADHMKVAFGPSWKESLCEKEIDEKIDPGQPALLVISLSALRSLDLLRELRPLTSECRAAKLFSKHMKIEEQASALKNRVNIASGTPSRIKKLIDVEALGLSRLAVIVLDMKTDTKGYSLLTLPQVRDEFWDLYRNYFHQRVLEGALRICLYDEIPVNIKKEKSNQDE
ncbi:protein CMSS1-like [Solanum tuberosum]|uniref:Protein CMSS1 n=1 Tax=Solanum tuberosum TaxID=4113 RepID=M1B013_SOLTU|nr:PREDICTED: protein CMSS1-like [Solanum tuberosum]